MSKMMRCVWLYSVSWVAGCYCLWASARTDSEPWWYSLWACVAVNWSCCLAAGVRMWRVLGEDSDNPA